MPNSLSIEIDLPVSSSTETVALSTGKSILFSTRYLMMFCCVLGLCTYYTRYELYRMYLIIIYCVLGLYTSFKFVFNALIMFLLCIGIIYELTNCILYCFVV